MISRQTNTPEFVYPIFILLPTSNSNLTINQPKSPIIFQYFRHEPTNKFYVTLRSRPQFVRVQVINLPRKTDFPFSNYKTKRCVIFIHRFTLILVVDTRSEERTVDRARICKFVTHSDVNKSICQRQSNWYRLLSTFRSKCRDVELEFAFSSRSFN